MLEILDLQVSYGGIKALDGISFGVPPGRIVTLLGANGSGKTTVLPGHHRAGGVQGRPDRF